MKLFWSGASPYVRKVMAAAICRGVDGRIDRVAVNAHSSPPELLAANPLSKVPCLVTDDGLALFDSPVICEYLDSLGDAPPLFPPRGAMRWRALKLQAMGDGVLDAAVMARMERARPREDARAQNIARQLAAIGRTLDALEVDPPAQHVDIGAVTIACALGYLDFRFADMAWRETRPGLSRWFDEFASNPGIARTTPTG